ncbi:hypothetical protein HAV15_010570 [Penicillium sp. str. |nr:hypothetical protein HAV15_010570 [Penicillium sp. str. \
MLSATVFSTAPTYRSKMQTVQHVTHTLRLMPYRVILKLSLPGRLVVSCEDNETELFWKHGRQATGNVVLHEEKCMDLSSELLHGNRFICPGGHAPCGCAQRLIGQGSKLVEFTHLDCSSQYFPMVAENTISAIYGFPPKPIFPVGQDPNPAVASPSVVWMEVPPDWSNKRQKRI